MIPALVTFPGLGFLGSMLLTPFARRLFHRLTPARLRLPAVGGPVIALSLAVGFALVWPFVPEDPSVRWIGGLLAATLLVCVSGVLADHDAGGPLVVAAGQIAAVVILLGSGVTVTSVRLPGGDCDLGAFAWPVTGLFLFGAINALRPLPGMDGLLTSTGLAMSAALGSMAMLNGHTPAGCVGLALAGALVGFLYFDFPPASVFLGTSGRMVIGLILGVVAVEGKLKGAAVFLFVAPIAILAILAIPLFDTATSIVRRRLLLPAAGLGLLLAATSLAYQATASALFALLCGLTEVVVLLLARLFGAAEVPHVQHEFSGRNNDDRPFRVCHLGKFYPPASGGIETSVQTLARAQAALGMDVEVVCVNHRNANGADVSWRTVAVTPTVRDADGDVRVTRVGRICSLARLDVCPGLPRILRELTRTPPDMVHMHTPNPTMLLAFALFCPTVPLVVTHHSDVIKQRFLRRLLEPLERLVYTRALRLFATSPVYGPGSTSLRRYPAKTCSLPLGINLAPYATPCTAALAHSATLKARHGDVLWLAVGRLIYYKGFEVALKALTRVPGTLLIVGTGPQESELKDLARSIGVTDRVVWKGYGSPDELIGAYHAARALWFPSVARSEAFGLVQVEAMASGCPVINTAIPDSGVDWVSLDGLTGLTVPVNDPAALASAARRLLDEPGLRDRLGAAGRSRADAEFDCAIMGQRSFALYRDALVRSAPPESRLPVPAPTTASL